MKRDDAALFGVLVVVACLPLILRDRYWIHVLNVFLIYCLLALGATVLTGLTGQLSMGQAGFYGVGAYLSALLSLRLGISPWVTIPLAALGGGLLLGAVVSLPCRRLAGPYLAITTIGFGQIVHTVLVQWRSLTMGPMGLTGIPGLRVGGFSLSGPMPYFYLLWVVVAVGLLVALRLSRQAVGKVWVALADDELAVRSIGVNTDYYKLLAFVISAMYTAGAGALYAHYMGVITPDCFTFEMSALILMMILLGGLGSVSGAVGGAAIVAFLPEILRGLEKYQMLVYGAMLVAIMVLAPHGLGRGLAEYVGRIKRSRLGSVPGGGHGA